MQGRERDRPSRYLPTEGEVTLMGSGKWLVVAGLTANIFGAICVGWRGPRRVPVPVTRESPSSEAGTAFGRFAERWGWRLIGAGFLLQLLGTVLWT